MKNFVLRCQTSLKIFQCTNVLFQNFSLVFLAILVFDKFYITIFTDIFPLRIRIFIYFPGLLPDNFKFLIILQHSFEELIKN